MDYQEIVTAYKNKSLDDSSLKEKLEMSRLLRGRRKDRVFNILSQMQDVELEIGNLQVNSDNFEKSDKFIKELNDFLNTNFEVIIYLISSSNAWKHIKEKQSDNKLENFKKLSISEKFKKLRILDSKFIEFLKYQRIADIRDCLRNGDDLDTKTISKLNFIITMFDNFKNKFIKTEFFCFDDNFLKSLIKFRKNKDLKLEDFMKKQGKDVYGIYKNLVDYFFFKNEDFIEIAENLMLTSSTLKRPIQDVIEAFKELSETELEMCHIEIAKEGLKELELKFGIPKKDSSQVIPIILIWNEKKDTTIARRIGSKKLLDFFNKIKEIEESTGAKAKLMVVSTSDKEVSLKRLQDIQKKAEMSGLPDLIDGLFGGYSSFKIDKYGNIRDISIMPEKVRKQVISLLDRPGVNYRLPKNMIDEDESYFVRYVFAKNKGQIITKDYINNFILELIKDEKVSKQPLKFMTFSEGTTLGIDVLLESQLKGILSISSYFDSRYDIYPEKFFNIDIGNIDEFIYGKEERDGIDYK